TGAGGGATETLGVETAAADGGFDVGGSTRSVAPSKLCVSGRGIALISGCECLSSAMTSTGLPSQTTLSIQSSNPLWLMRKKWLPLWMPSSSNDPSTWLSPTATLSTKTFEPGGRVWTRIVDTGSAPVPAVTWIFDVTSIAR